MLRQQSYAIKNQLVASKSFRRQNNPIGGYFACSSLVLYGIRIVGFHARKGPITGGFMHRKVLLLAPMKMLDISQDLPRLASLPHRSWCHQRAQTWQSYPRWSKLLIAIFLISPACKYAQLFTKAASTLLPYATYQWFNLQVFSPVFF